MTSKNLYALSVGLYSSDSLKIPFLQDLCKAVINFLDFKKFSILSPF